MRRFRATVVLAAFACLTPCAAFAYHDTIDTDGRGVPVHLFVILGAAVVVLLVFLSRWQPM